MSSSTSGSPAPGAPPSTTTPPGSPPAPAAASKFLYIGGGAKGFDGFMAAYSINPQTVAITPTPNSFGFRSSGDNMVRSPQDSSFYGTGHATFGDVRGYIPNPADGTPQLISSVQVDGAGELAISPDGRFVFATAIGGIATFTVAQGRLSPVAGSPFNPGSPDRPTFLDAVVSPDGRFLFVTGFTGQFPNPVSHIYSLAIASDGKLSPVGDIQAIGNNALVVSRILIDNSGRFLYAPGGPQTSPTIHVYSIGQGTGTLTEVAGSPFPFVGPKPDPNSLAYPMFIGPDNLLYVLAIDRSQVLAFSLSSANGQPSQASSSSIAFPGAISFDRNGRVAYILHASSNNTVIEAFSIGANGVLTPIPGAQASASFGSDIAPHIVLAD